MPGMQRAPFVISAAVVAGALALTVHLALEPEPFAADSATVLAVGILLFAVITTVGLLLSRGQWALRLGITLVAAQIALGLALDLGAWAFASLGLNAAALAGMTGPWLRGWLRRRPAATGPGTRPILLLLGALALVPGVAVASPEGLAWQHGLLAVTGLLGAYAYSRASALGLWLLRIALVPLAVAAAAASPAVGAAYLLAHVGATTVLAWSRESVRAITPLLDHVYGPRTARPLDPRAKDAP